METIQQKSALKVLVENCLESGIFLKEFKYFTSRRFIVMVLIKNKFNQCKTARSIGVHRNTLGRLIRENHINLKELKEVQPDGEKS